MQIQFYRELFKQIKRPLAEKKTNKQQEIKMKTRTKSQNIYSYPKTHVSLLKAST